MLSDAYWLTTAQNNLVGPQVGARWFRESNRLQLSAEGRFMAAYDLQNINQIAHLDTPQQLNEKRWKCRIGQQTRVSWVMAVQTHS